MRRGEESRQKMRRRGDSVLVVKIAISIKTTL